ncbi:alpha/beta hydrolase [Kitasatospora brasiliensis]|uniref:alpha/beta hydrolase n=1 Tax=Kitasatospora brasiliensis TaxID=3058040 RepID=UPI00292E8A4D|nr:alpha/beta hydrolase [Kitasatospora sp. K002]
MPRTRLTATLRVAAAALVLAGLTPAAAMASPAGPFPAGPSSALPSPAVPRPDWKQPCTAAGFECDTVDVPLDYREPRGPSIHLSVVRRPATDRAHRIGTLFFNPGGPAVSGTAALPAVYGLFPERVRERFDIVSFDPRGVGASTTLHCFPDQTAEQNLLDRLPAGFPVGAEQQALWTDTYARFGRQCADSDTAGLAAHLSTADVARDLDVLRQAVGDERLSYLGTSYGTLLGATYANLFPRRVRAMVLDSALDPVAWSTGRGPADRALPPFLRTGSDLASARTLDAFLDRCGAAGPAACAFSAGGAEATRAKYARLLDRLREGPVTVDSAQGAVAYDYASAASTAATMLYAASPVPGVPGTGWAALGGWLQQLWTAPGTPSALPPTGGPRGQAQVLGVLCADAASPTGADYGALADRAEARSGAVGPFWVWQTQRCASWPSEAARDRYDGPWDRPTAAPVLVVADTGDPAWPYEGSRAMADSLARGRLLTVAGYGHTVLGNPSACAAAHEERYLLDGELPPRGTVCAPDHQPFE